MQLVPLVKDLTDCLNHSHQPPHPSRRLSTSAGVEALDLLQLVITANSGVVEWQSCLVSESDAVSFIHLQVRHLGGLVPRLNQSFSGCFQLLLALRLTIQYLLEQLEVVDHLWVQYVDSSACCD